MGNSLRLKYFTLVDELLVFNWLRCLAGDLTFMRRNIAKGSPENDVLAWREFMEDHIDRIGMSDEQKRFHSLKEKHTEAIISWVAEPMDSPRKALLYMEVEMAQDDIDYFLKQYEENAGASDPMQIEKKLARLSNLHKRTISSRTTTVMELHVLTELEN